MKLKDIKPGDTCYVKYSQLANALSDIEAPTVMRLPGNTVLVTRRPELIDRVVRRRWEDPQCTILEVGVPYAKGHRGVRVQVVARSCTEYDVTRDYEDNQWSPPGPARDVPAEAISVTVHYSALISEDAMIGEQADRLIRVAEMEAHHAAQEHLQARRDAGDPEVLLADLQALQEQLEDAQAEVPRTRRRIELLTRLHSIAADEMREIEREHYERWSEQLTQRWGHDNNVLTRWEKDPVPEITSLIRREEKHLRDAEHYLQAIREKLDEAQQRYDTAVLSQYEH